MLGAIIGDICGSRWEGGQPLDGTFEMFAEHTTATDDTICTLAVADALLTTRDYAASLRKWVRLYPTADYGGRFKAWAHSEDGPYQSYGNGGAMRVSPVALFASSLEEALALATATAVVSHDHPEGVRGAQAVAALCFASRAGASREELAQLSRHLGYEPSRPAEYDFTTDAAATVPIAIWAALEGKDFAEAIETAAYCGGDTDTICAMTGAIAEHRFGIPDRFVQKALLMLDTRQRSVVIECYRVAPRPLLHPSRPAVSIEGGCLRGTREKAPRTNLRSLFRWPRRV